MDLIILKYLTKLILKIFKLPIDLFFCIAVIPGACILLIFRILGAGRLPLTTSLLKKIGVFPIRNHYFEPLFDDSQLLKPLDEDRYLPGIDFNLPAQLNLLQELTFSHELLSLNLERSIKTADSFNINNGSFESGDADFLYQIIRYIKPTKIIEIGSGHSTKIARLALKKNKSESSLIYKHICVEPYEQKWLDSLDDITIIRELVENTQFNWEDELNAGDLLFIDSSHMIRPQGDVLKEYLEILPQLKPGVFIHVHDIFTPKDYPKSWITDDVRFWNEQYLLEALLTNTYRYEIIAALNFLKHNHFENLKLACPYLTTEHEPGSFYFKVK